MRSIELVMGAYAEKFGEDKETWAISGLLHDADYEAYPEKHPQIIVDKLKALGEDKIAHAISAHYTKWNVPYENLLDKALLACDELTGFIIACCQVRPDGISSLETKSVIKKLKDKSFAAKVERDEVYKGRIGLRYYITNAGSASCMVPMFVPPSFNSPATPYIYAALDMAVDGFGDAREAASAVSDLWNQAYELQSLQVGVNGSRIYVDDFEVNPGNSIFMYDITLF